MRSTENLTTLKATLMNILKVLYLCLKILPFFNMFVEEETLWINGKSEYNQQFHGFKAWWTQF